MTPMISLKDVHKTYGQTHALDGLSLEVVEGQAHGLLGPNGAGKTTTLRILLGLAKADSGEVSILSADPWKSAAQIHAQLAYVPGDIVIWPGLSGGEFIDAIGRLRTGFNLKRRDELISAFELDPRKKVRAYSKGNRQKLSLISALACDVDLYLFDEPTDGLDPLMAQVFREQITCLSKLGRTVLLSSHVLAEVEAVCDYVSIVRAGRLIETGSLSSLRHLSRTTLVVKLERMAPDLPGMHDLVRTGPTLKATVETDAIPALMSSLVTYGIESLEVRPPTLEEMFMQHYREDPEQ
ncbi:MAG: ABC transporter ATP-binding protein [Actinomycetota bacterium]|nr:ABC transporter ATP-binding protein [Actinomycetota bacterium]